MLARQPGTRYHAQLTLTEHFQPDWLRADTQCRHQHHYRDRHSVFIGVDKTAIRRNPEPAL
jgi:hypothetical protein